MRIGINVPSELLKQVKEISPAVNVSQVCREALKQRVEVAQRAAAQAARDGANEHVERLNRSVAKPPIEPDWEALALADARAWVSTVKPEHWEMFFDEADFFRRTGRDEMELVSFYQDGGGVWSHMREHMRENEEWYELDFEYGTTSNLREKATREYGRAWLGYVYEVRRLLEKRRKDEYDRVMAERAEQRRSRPAPELPSQLV